MCPSSAFRGVLQLLHVSLKDNRHYWFWKPLWCLCGTQIQFKLVLFRGPCKTKPWKKVTLSNTLFTHLFCFLLQQFTLHTICSNCSRRFGHKHFVTSFQTFHVLTSRNRGGLQYNDGWRGQGQERPSMTHGDNSVWAEWLSCKMQPFKIFPEKQLFPAPAQDAELPQALAFALRTPHVGTLNIFSSLRITQR